MNDKVIDEILKEVATSIKYSMKAEEDFSGYNDFISYREHLSLMCDNNWLLYKPFSNEGTLLLSVFGKKVFESGGWLTYLELEKQKSIKDNLRQERKDKSDELDLKIKQWTYKAKYAPFIVSGLSFIGMVISIIIALKSLNYKKDKLDLQQVKQQIQELQYHARLQDSLRQADTLLKKHNE